MAKNSKRKIREEPTELSEREEKARERFDDMSERNEELCEDHDVEDACLELYADIERGFSDQYERANEQMDFWDIYNCILGPKQFYTGNSKVFVPLIHDAVNARKTRFVNQIFPPSGKNVDVITSEEERPQAMMALLEFYIRKTRLRARVLPQLMKNGDIEGHYNLYVSWIKNERHVTWRTRKQETLLDEPDVEIPDGETYWDVAEKTIIHGYPDVEVLPDADVCVLPTNARSPEDALARGGSVTVLRRWSKAQIRKMIRDGDIDENRGKQLMEEMSSKSQGVVEKHKNITDAAGIKNEGNKKFALVYETWTMLNVDGKRRIHRVRFGGERLVLSVKRNPFWCDHIPLISDASDPTEGTFKGRSAIKCIDTIQYAANDAVNQGFDSATYALCPIIMTDPEKNPRVGSMILSTSAVWETSPQDTQFAKFPPLWQDAFEIVAACKSQIFQTLSVNPAMIPSSDSKGGKKSQAIVAQEQQVDILTTADVVTGLEGSVLTPLMRWFIYLDHQYRDEDLTLQQFGMVGKMMNMEVVKPVQMDRRWEVKWFGVESARSAQQMQLQMSGLNMIMHIPPQQYQGYKLNLAPVLQQFMENLFGPRMAAEVFQDIRKQLTMDVQEENQMLVDGFLVPVHPMDDDPSHMKQHMELLKMVGNDPSLGSVRSVVMDHLMRHQMQMMQKNQAQQMQQMAAQQGGNAPAGPKPGAKSSPPRGGQQPNGAIHKDQMRDPSAMPRQRGMM